MLNAMTIDLEDWGQAVLDPAHPVTRHVVDNLRRVLDLLSAHGVKATFFALGKVCEQFPELLPDVAAAGHEIASHGFGHRLVYHQTPSAFADDVRRSIDIIEAQTGCRPAGYRAPAFSITRQSLWAGPILAELGFRYSSSVFPINGRRYGIPDTPRGPYRWSNAELIECPLSTVRIVGHNVPVCGGGYTRLLPGPLLSWAVRHLNRRGLPAVVYLHPYELSPGEVASFRNQGTRVTWHKSLTQSLWRSRVPTRLARLFSEFQFATISQVISETTIATPGSTAEPQTAGLETCWTAAGQGSYVAS